MKSFLNKSKIFHPYGNTKIFLIQNVFRFFSQSQYCWNGPWDLGKSVCSIFVNESWHYSGQCELFKHILTFVGKVLNVMHSQGLEINPQNTDCSFTAWLLMILFGMGLVTPCNVLARTQWRNILIMVSNTT